jgi:hypothetical protein
MATKYERREARRVQKSNKGGRTMKTLNGIRGLLLASFALCAFSCAPSQEATQEEMTHEFIVAFPGLRRGQVFDATMKWMANYFVSAKHVIEYQDKESGTIVGNGVGKVNTGSILGDISLYFTMNIDVRDEKARIRFENLETSYNGMFFALKQQAGHLDAQKNFAVMVNDLTAFVNKKDEF